MKIIREMHFLKLFFLIFLSAFIGFTPSSFGQKATKKSSQLVPYRVGAKWGFSDLNGKIVIEPKYDEVEILNSNLFKVRKDWNEGWLKDWLEDRIDNYFPADYGIVNMKGKVIFRRLENFDISSYNPNSIDVRKFSIFNKNLLNALIDSTGKLKISTKHTIDYELKHNTFIVKTDILSERKKFGLYSKRKLWTSMKFDELDTKSYQAFLIRIINKSDVEGLRYAKYKEIKIKPNSVRLRPYTYEHFSDYSEGLAVAALKDNFFGFVNHKGKLAFNRKFREFKVNEEGRAFNDGLAAISEDGEYYGYINKKGKTIIPFEYTEATAFKNGLAIVKKNDKFGLIDTKGNVIEPFKHKSLNWSSDYKIIYGTYYDIFSINGYTSLDGHRTAKKYSDIFNFNNGFALVRMNSDSGSTYGYININGQEITPLIYQSGHEFSEGLAAVKKSDKWGFIDTTGKVVIPFKFSQVSSFQSGRAAVSANKKWFFIDRNGNKITDEFTYSPSQYYKGFYSVFSHYQGDGNDRVSLYHIYNDKGEKISTETFSEVSLKTLDFGLIYVCQSSGCGFLDRSGKVIIPMEYYFERRDWINEKSSLLHNGLLKVHVYKNGYRKFLGYMSIDGQKYWQD